MTARIAVLASGGGTNLQALLDACTSGALDAEVALVCSDVPGAGALARAEGAGVPTVVVARTPGEARRDHDARLADAVGAVAPELVVLAGYMRLLSSTFLDRFSGRVLNLHPALPGELPGVRAIERAYDEFTRGLRNRTGVMVHEVPDEGVDSGPVIVAEEVPIHPGNTLADLAARVHAVEHRLIVEAVRRVLAGRGRSTMEPDA